MKTAFALFLVVLLAIACAAAYEGSARQDTCPAGTDPFVEYRLFFGRSTADGMVSEQEWHAFLASEITSRFPEGLTVLDAYGQWQTGSGELTREQTKVVLILAPPGDAARKQTEAIVEAYQRRFNQESVLRAITDACVAF